jgi:hypothetical protein
MASAAVTQQINEDTFPKVLVGANIVSSWCACEIYPITGLYRPLGLPEFLDNRHMKVVRMSAPRTGRRYPQGDKAYKPTVNAATNSAFTSKNRGP